MKIRKKKRHLHVRRAGLLPDALRRFSSGKMDRRQAVASLRLRDYAELLQRLGSAGLPLPRLPEDDIQRQAALFATVWAST